MKPTMMKVLILQAGVCALRIAWLQDFVGFFWMLLVVALGFHGWHENMNLTYICAWGLVCTVNAFFDLLGMILPLAFDLVTLEWITMILRAMCPLSYLVGASFAYHLYLDWAQEHNVKTGWMTSLVPDVWSLAVSKIEKRLPMSMREGGAAASGYPASPSMWDSYGSSGSPPPTAATLPSHPYIGLPPTAGGPSPASAPPAAAAPAAGGGWFG
eukprot:TRINITY_DN26164_c0_g1_i2.p1 TRINITY_DN26164_c0_g1~~TRINITY_DN26164_c0_g1_i2.p1  ORF type:complete len:213 (-),score=41.01 TRINITY_DN26164_c0_g1_i2:56-694(-)